MPADWISYDSAAACHGRVAGRAFFEQPARELISRLDLRSAERILDVGTGSGVAALLARQAAPKAAVTGTDPSREMLRVARENGLKRIVAGRLPDLPFREHAFDCAVANFVLSHLESYKTGLAEMARVVRPEGEVGVTAWGAMKNPYREFWHSLAESFVNARDLSEVTRSALPWEDWLSDPDHLAQALRESGLVRVEVHRASHSVRIGIADFLATRESAMEARFMRQKLSEADWQRFCATVRSEFERRFSDPIDHERDALIGTGVRGAGS
jgi:trans-aconitate methyltransferase